MLKNTVHLKKNILCFQVFRSINEYTKDEKSFAQRKDKLAWKSIESDTGYVENQTAYLPIWAEDSTGLQNCDLLLILDDHLPPIGSILLTKEHHHWLKANKINKLDIFEVRTFEDQITLHLKYGYFEIGIPERDDMKLCELSQGKAIEIKINGKTDSSLTSRRERVYKEQAYIFEPLGEVNSIVFVSERQIQKTKKIPENRKVIDLNKPLW